MSNVANTTEKKKYRYQAEGYADIPGKGPAGETCKSCRFSTCRRMSKNYWKCFLMRDKWKGTVTTDIRLSSPACSKWQPRPTACVCGEVLQKNTPAHILEHEGEMIHVCFDCFLKQMPKIVVENPLLQKH